MKKTDENGNSAAWWAELDEIRENKEDYNWCCKLIIRSGFNDYIQREIGQYVSLKFNVHYCPHCGTLLEDKKPVVQTESCCYLFKDLGLEGMVYEEPATKENGESDITVHRLIMKYCFHCGKEINWNSGDDPNGWAGDDSCSCGDCSCS